MNEEIVQFEADLAFVLGSKRLYNDWDAWRRQTGVTTIGALMVLNAVGCGMLLRVPRLGDGAVLVNRPDIVRGLSDSDVAVPAVVLHEVLEGPVRRFLFELTENRIGDDKAWRAGWRELGLDGEHFRFFVCLQ